MFGEWRPDPSEDATQLMLKQAEPSTRGGRRVDQGPHPPRSAEGATCAERKRLAFSIRGLVFAGGQAASPCGPGFRSGAPGPQVPPGGVTGWRG